MRVSTELQIALDPSDNLTCAAIPNGIRLCAVSQSGQTIFIDVPAAHAETLRTGVRILEGVRDAEVIRRGARAQRAAQEFTDAVQGRAPVDQVVEVNRNGRA